jgi:5-methylcytosine-specific restriction enzyme B
MPKFQEYELIYRAFDLFISNCLLGNKSLLWPEAAIWTPENVAEVKRRVVDNPLFGTDQSFTQKLLQQMKDAAPELWMLLADIYYVYYLPSTSNKVESKRAAIRWVIEQGGVENPSADSWLWKALEIGFVRTSRLYHMKHTQFWLIIAFADYLKHIPDAEAVVGDYKKLQQILDRLLQNIPNKRDRANDMRHAMLYMAFPEHYEPILGNTDKNLIVQTYGKQISAGLSVDIDASIENIRDVYQKTSRLKNFRLVFIHPLSLASGKRH